MNTLPAKPDLERFVLGYALICGEQLHELRTFVDADDFVLDKHKKIWKRICELYDRGDAVDRITVFHELTKFNEAEAAGGLGYLIDLDTGIPQLDHVPRDYVERLRDASMRRRAMLWAEHLQLCAADETNSCQSVYDLGMSFAEKVIANEVKSAGPIGTHEMISRDGLQALLSPRAHGAIELPLAKLDSALAGFAGGQMIVLMAETSRGKSSLAYQIAAKAACDGCTPVIWSLEIGEREVFQSICQQCSGVWPGRLRMSPPDRDRLQMAAIQLNDYPVYIDCNSSSVAGFVAALRRVRTKFRLGMAIVDHIQLIRGERRTRAQEVSENSRALKLAAMELDIPILVLSQVDRASVKGDGEIGLHSAKESGDIENDADVIMWIKSEEEFSWEHDTLASIKIGKQRNGRAGLSIKVLFRPSHRAFMEVDDND